MPTIRIYFQGVAVHLIGAVPGVPCRVVLPDATASYLYPTTGPDGKVQMHSSTATSRPFNGKVPTATTSSRFFAST